MVYLTDGSELNEIGEERREANDAMRARAESMTQEEVRSSTRILPMLKLIRDVWMSVLSYRLLLMSLVWDDLYQSLHDWLS